MLEQTAQYKLEEIPAPVLWVLEKMPPLRLPIYFLWRLATRWGQDQCPLKAAAMAFFGLLSIFPIILAAVSILATVLAGNTAALQTFQNFVEQFFPGPTGDNISLAMKNAAEKIAGGTSATTLSIVAIGSLLWSGRAFFETLAEVLNNVWPGTTARTFWQNQLVLWSTFAGAAVLCILSSLATFLVALVNGLLQYMPEMFLERLPLIEIISRVLAFLLTLLMFWLIYRFLPNVEGARRNRLVFGAAFIAALGWEIAKVVFTRFMVNLDRYEATYGSVAGVVITMMWIYFSSLIILLGAVAAVAYEETKKQWPHVAPTLARKKGRS
jgi:membrane protein